MGRLKHQTPPETAPVTADGLRRNQLALEALITAAGAAGVTTFNSRSGVVTLTSGDVTTALGFTPSSGGGYTYASVSASYTETATTGEKVVAVTASGQTVTLPTAVGNTAKFHFKLMVAGTLTLDGSGAQTIDGGATAVLTAQYEAITIVSDNANWLVI